MKTLYKLTVIALVIVFVFLTSISIARASEFSQEDRERLIGVETTLKEFKDSVDRRLEFMQNLMIAMLAVFGGLCGVFVGLLLWDRKTFKEKAKEEALRELEAKYRLGDWINALREYAKERDELAEILRKLNLL
ncbi:hypothetical protein TAGGR_2150 [Thermodesulfovibrio aggregans]|uniref:Uncharacterized protein n=1 Tax=Thermodesulfovibrio aggregans TaxID=86166 RepID=A0A0U9HWP7_9BACT|nr:hypothetical protein [Thermodesulfovibrio aggregans]GAQ95261.1 hypothetical protein TAGGR_2150 [Thermodesulfovibrio aggregans]